MLVRVHVGHDQAGALQPGDLGHCFRLDLRFGDAAALQVSDEADQRRSQRPVLLREGGNGSGRGTGHAIHKHDMAANGESRAGGGCSHGLRKPLPIGHQRGGTDGTGPRQLGNGAIDPASQAEVVRVHNQPHRRVHLRSIRQHRRGREAGDAGLF